YRNKAGETLTIVPALHEDELFFERAGAKRVVLLPADLTVLRSADMKTVVLLKPAVPPPAEVTLKDGDRGVVYARVGNAPAVTTDATRQPAAPPAAPPPAARAASA